MLIALVAGGCQQVSLRTWRESVEHYVWDQGNGDPSVLRDLPTSGTWKGFSVISENDAASATDANGILIAHRAIGAKTYFIYLVGLVKQRQVQDIRLALLHASGEGFDWRFSRRSADGLRVYRDFQDAHWKKLNPQGGAAPWSRSGFPCEGDVFRISVAGNRVIATHEASGAQWMLEAPQDGPTTGPAVAGAN